MKGNKMKKLKNAEQHTKIYEEKILWKRGSDEK